MNILVDVNVFEDVFRQRQGWEASLTVLNYVGNKQATGHVSALTPPILYFFRRRTRSMSCCQSFPCPSTFLFSALQICEHTEYCFLPGSSV